MKTLTIKRENKLDLKLTTRKYARLYGAKVDYWFRTSGSWPK